MSGVTSTQMFRYAGWSAYACAAISFLSGVFLLLFFLSVPVPGPSATVGSSPLDFGLINDYSGLIVDAFMLPLPFALGLLTHLQLRQRQPTPRRQLLLNWIAEALGSVGVLTLLTAQALLVTGMMSFDMNITVTMIGLALLGAWLLLANVLGRATGVLVRWLAGLGGLTGALFLSASAFIVLSQPFDMLEGATLALLPPVLIGTLIALAVLGGLAYLVSYPLWLAGLGYQLFAAAAPLATRTRQVQSVRYRP